MLSTTYNRLEITKIEEQLKALDDKYDLLTKQIRNELDEYVAVENSSYENLIEHRTLIAKQIQRLQEQIRQRISLSHKNSKKEADVGSRVLLENHKDCKMLSLVGDHLAVNPAQGFISITSPLGNAILGKKAGEKVEITTPSGKLHYTLIGVE